jgi:hypothetical protein
MKADSECLILISSADPIPIEDQSWRTHTDHGVDQIDHPSLAVVLVLDGNLIQNTIIHTHLVGTILPRDKKHRGSSWGELRWM